MIVRKIELAPDSTEQDLKAVARYFHKRGQLLGTGKENGIYHVIVKFENKTDFLAFAYQQAYTAGDTEKQNQVIAALAKELELRPGEVEKLKKALKPAYSKYGKDKND